MTEIWKAIKGYEGLYEVSNLGRVKSWRNNILAQAIISSGYLQVKLYKDGIGKSRLVHRLVADAFLENPNKYRCVNHKDECKTNNIVENLEYCTHKYNLNYGTVRERISKARTNNPLTSYKVLCVETGEIFESSHEIERRLGLAHQNISATCMSKKGHSTCGGYHWEYVNNENQNIYSFA